MKQALDNISALELFGAASRLAEQEGDKTLSGIISLGGAYQAATAVVALLFIFIIVLYFEQFRYLIISSFSKQSSRSDIHIYSAEIKNIELFTSFIGVFLLSLLMMRLSVTDGVKVAFSSISFMSSWGIGGVALLGITTLMVVERIMLYAVGIVSGRSDVCKMIWHTKLLYFSLAIILLAPMLVLVLLTEDLVAQISFYISVAICFLPLILFVKETFLLFRAQRFSIFHWILYLCALEIFPLSLLLAPIVRG